MSYQKPELFVLTLAANAILSGDGTGDGSHSGGANKDNTISETGSSNDGPGHDGTSTTGGAYEVDE